MRNLKLTLLTAILFVVANTATAQYYYTLTNGTSVSTYEDAAGLVGIGTASPVSVLDIQGTCAGNTIPQLFAVTNNNVGSCTSPADYFLAQKITSNYPSLVTETDFIIKSNGSVGIGIAEPLSALHVKCKNWYDPDAHGDLPAPIELYEDPAGNILGCFSNMGTGTGSPAIPGGAFIIFAADGSAYPSFAVINNNDASIPFAVLADGTLVSGIDPTSYTPSAQVNIGKHNSYGHLLKIQSADQTENYLDVNNDGHVGIGLSAQSGALVALYDAGADTHLDLIASGGHTKAIRFMGSTSYTPRHQITEVSGDFVIDPGIASGGGNDKLKIDGNVAITRSSGEVDVDIIETSSTVTGNAQLRWIANDGSTVRHKITEDASGNLLIDPGVSAGSDKVKIDGALEVTGNGTVDGNGTITGTGTITGAASCGSTLAVTGASTLSSTLAVSGATSLSSTLGVTGATTLSSTLGVTGATTLSSTLAVSGAASFASTMYVGGHYPTGAYSGYTLGVHGDLIATRVIVETDYWSDKVFATDYNLKSLSSLENYITANKHLPEIPSECEVIEKGIDVGEMNKLLLQKVEELTLYVIAQQKQIDAFTKK